MNGLVVSFVALNRIDALNVLEDCDPMPTVYLIDFRLSGGMTGIDLAQEVLRTSHDHDEKAITIEQIQKFVAEYYQLKLSELKSRNNSKSVAMPRQVAMYLCKSLTNASLPEIGKSFGGKHHSTVIHSIKKVEDMRSRDASFNSLIHTLLESFR